MGVASIRFCPDILCHLEFLPDGALVNNRRGRPRISIQNHRPAVLISQRNIDQITAFAAMEGAAPVLTCSAAYWPGS